MSELEFEARRLEAKDESARRNFRPRLDRTGQDTTLGLCGDHRAVERTNRPRYSTVCGKGLIANGIGPHAQTRGGYFGERGVFPRRTRGIRIPAAKGRKQKREPEQTAVLSSTCSTSSLDGMGRCFWRCWLKLCLLETMARAASSACNVGNDPER